MKTSRSPSPLEAAGAVIVTGAYLVEWSFRAICRFPAYEESCPGTTPFRTWGAVLFAAGLWGRLRPNPKDREVLSWGGLIAICLVAAALIALHQPRITGLLIRDMPEMTQEEKDAYRIEPLQRMRAVILANEFARWQKRHLAKLDQAEVAAKRAGIGRELIRQTFGRVLAPEIPKEYDAADMLELPEPGTEKDPRIAKSVLGRYFTLEPEPVLPVPKFPLDR